MTRNITHRLYRLEPKKTMFLLCDIQEKFKPAFPLMKNLIKNSKKLMEASDIFNVPLFITEQYPDKLGPTVGELDASKACAIIPKTQFSMMTPAVKVEIDKIFPGKPKTAVLFGLETHVCLEQTAFDLINSQIDVWLPADCCISRLNQDRDLALERLRDIGCIITTSESIIFNLLCDVKHKNFKKVASLVKKISKDMQIWRPTPAAKAED